MFDGFLLILKGINTTISLAVLSSLLALAVSFVAGLGRISKHRLLRWISSTYIEFFRGTSLYVQLFWIFYVLPLFGVALDPMDAAVLTLGLNAGAYGAEIVRGGIESVSVEQQEACIAVNLTRYQALRHVIVPQAVVVMLPPFGNLAVTMLKMTSIASLISLQDLTYQAQVVRNQTGQTLVPFATILLIYFVLSVGVKILFRNLERCFSSGLDRPPRGGT